MTRAQLPFCSHGTKISAPDKLELKISGTGAGLYRKKKLHVTELSQVGLTVSC